MSFSVNTISFENGKIVFSGEIEFWCQYFDDDSIDIDLCPEGSYGWQEVHFSYEVGPAENIYNPAIPSDIVGRIKPKDQNDNNTVNVLNKDERKQNPDSDNSIFVDMNEKSSFMNKKIEF